MYIRGMKFFLHTQGTNITPFGTSCQNQRKERQWKCMESHAEIEKGNRRESVKGNMGVKYIRIKTHKTIRMQITLLFCFCNEQYYRNEN